MCYYWNSNILEKVCYYKAIIKEDSTTVRAVRLEKN